MLVEEFFGDQSKATDGQCQQGTTDKGTSPFGTNPTNSLNYQKQGLSVDTRRIYQYENASHFRVRVNQIDDSDKDGSDYDDAASLY